MSKRFPPFLWLLAASTLAACGPAPITAKMQLNGNSVAIKSIIGVLDTAAYQESLTLIATTSTNLCSNISSGKGVAGLTYARFILRKVDDTSNYATLTTGSYTTAAGEQPGGNVQPGQGVPVVDVEVLDSNCTNTVDITMDGSINVTNLKTLEGSFDLTSSDGKSSLTGNYTATTCSGATASQFQTFDTSGSCG